MLHRCCGGTGNSLKPRPTSNPQWMPVLSNSNKHTRFDGRPSEEVQHVNACLQHACSPCLDACRHEAHKPGVAGQEGLPTQRPGRYEADRVRRTMSGQFGGDLEGAHNQGQTTTTADNACTHSPGQGRVRTAADWQCYCVGPPCYWHPCTGHAAPPLMVMKSVCMGGSLPNSPPGCVIVA